MIQRCLSIVILLASSVLWLFSPFMGVNMLTIGWNMQPAALEFVNGGVYMLGNVTRTDAYLLSILSAAGLGLLLLLAIVGAKKAGGIISLLLAIVMAVFVVKDVTAFRYISDRLAVTELVGLGYIGITVLLLANTIASFFALRTRPAK